MLFRSVLIRMKGDKDEIIYPDSFIPIAEQTGQIKMIDFWVLETSLKQLIKHPDISLSVNLSGNSMEYDELFSSIQNLPIKNSLDRGTSSCSNIDAIINNIRLIFLNSFSAKFIKDSSFQG